MQTLQLQPVRIIQGIMFPVPVKAHSMSSAKGAIGTEQLFGNSIVWQVSIIIYTATELPMTNQHSGLVADYSCLRTNPFAAYVPASLLSRKDQAAGTCFYPWRWLSILFQCSDPAER